jgi:hypothetical protein
MRRNRFGRIFCLNKIGRRIIIIGINSEIGTRRRRKGEDHRLQDG